MVLESGPITKIILFSVLQNPGKSYLCPTIFSDLSMKPSDNDRNNPAAAAVSPAEEEAEAPKSFPEAESPQGSDPESPQTRGKKSPKAPNAESAKRPGQESPWRERLKQRRAAIMRRIEYNRLRRIRRHTVPKYTHCKNCGTRLEGMYCHRCGQYALDIEQPFWKYFKQYFENVYQFDSKVWQTLWLLFRRPGLLTLEFNAGKINSYVHPLRLFMFISALFFLAVAFFIPEADKALSPVEKQLSDLRDPFILESVQSKQVEELDDAIRQDTVVWVGHARSIFTGLESLVEVHDRPGPDTLQVRMPKFLIEENYLVALPRDSIYWSNDDSRRPDVLNDYRNEVQQLHREMVYKEVIGWFSQWLPLILLLFIPLFALLLRLFFRRSRMLYMGHFVTALHLHSVQLILVFILLLCAQWSANPGNWAMALLALYLLHMIFVFHRIYGNGWGKTVVKSLLIHGFYMFVMVIILFGLFIWLIYPLMKENNWW